MKNILLAALCLLVINCSGSKKFSDARIDVSSLLSISSFGGGGILYARNKELKINHSLSFQADDVRLLLDYGTWEFVALTWDGASPMMGALKCGKVVTTLTEASVNIELNVSSSNCVNDFYSPAAYRTGTVIKPLSLINCNNISGVTTGTNCDNGARGNLEFFKIKLLTNASLPLQTNCLNSNSHPLSITTALPIIPVGSADFSPSAEIEVFSDSSCTQSRRKLTYQQGFIGSSPALNSTKIFAGATNSELYVESSGFYISGVSPFNASLGSSVDKTLTIYNYSGFNGTSMAATIVAPFSFKGGTYPGTGGTCATTLNDATSCTVVLTYTPVTTGSTNINLNISIFLSASRTYTFTLLGSNPLTAFTSLTGAVGAATTSSGTAIDNSGNFYVTGDTNGSLDGEMLIGTDDAYVSKYDKDGVKIWTRHIGVAGGITQSYGITLDSASNIYITGNTNGNLNAETKTGTIDLFVTKLDTNGNTVWTRMLGVSTKTTYPKDLAIDSSNNLLIVGHTNGPLDGNPITGTNDSFVVKYDSNGTKIWSKLSGVATKNTHGTGVTTDASGNVYVTGRTNGALDGESLNGAFIAAFVMKYSSGGTKIWTRLTGGTSGSSDGSKIAVDNGNGSLFVIGSTNVGLDGVSKIGSQDAFILKYDLNGYKSFTRILGGNVMSTQGLSITNPKNGFFYVGGHTNGNLDGQTLIGTQGAYVTKYSISGLKQWTKLMGASGASSEVKALYIDSGGFALAAGKTSGNFDGETINGSQDGFLTTQFNY